MERLRLRVKDWDQLYENNKSRTVEHCSFVCVPNKQHGMGLTRVLAEPDGGAIYGIFNLILGACSRQRRPRNGWLTDDGREMSNPWSIDDLAFRWRRPREEVARAVEVLSSTRVAWLEISESAKADQAATDRSGAGAADSTVLSGGSQAGETVLRGATPSDSQSNGNHRHIESVRSVSDQCTSGVLNGMEGKGRELRLEGVCGEAGVAGPSPPMVMPSFPVFPCIAGRRLKDPIWTLSPDHIAELQATFPGVNVAAECRVAHGWIKANPTKRKTARGMPKFIFDWMSRSQNRAGGRGGNDPVRRSSEEWKKGKYVPG